jgi:hypothetical protein
LSRPVVVGDVTLVPLMMAVQTPGNFFLFFFLHIAISCSFSCSL